MTGDMYETYREILRSELIPAQGCTEPIAIAYAAAVARKTLGAVPERLELRCSGNVIKNVMGVVIPRSGGRRGVDTAAILGALGGDPEAELNVLESVRPEHVQRLDELLASGYCDCALEKGVEKLFISLQAFAGDHSSLVVVQNRHTNITRIERDGEVLLDHPAVDQQVCRKEALSLDGILDYAETEDLSVLRGLLGSQLQHNLAVAREGLEKPCGAQVGRTLLQSGGDTAAVRACAMAAAASDARMSGCVMPVVINSGSGNQGIAASVPVAEYARALGAGEEPLFRALAISNLTALLQKKNIGALSAYCGAVCAAAGAGAAVTYLRGGSRAAIKQTVVNTLGTVSGIVCDGAKASCAAKIAAALGAAFLAGDMALAGLGFQPGEGLVFGSAEDTIRAAGTLGREGMRETDEVILRLMLRRGAE